jgi:hypothetical protein
VQPYRMVSPPQSMSLRLVVIRDFFVKLNFEPQKYQIHRLSESNSHQSSLLYKSNRHENKSMRI